MKEQIQVRAVLRCSMIAALLVGSSALAQTSPATPTAKPLDTSLNDIVVTARRREENVQRVPVAITAFSQQTLQRKSIASAFDLNKAVAGLNVAGDSGTNTLPVFSIRGRGQFYGAAAGSVETYFADVPLSAPFQMPTLPPQFFDLQSVQVLKGPQGTLFGRNSTGGAVLFVPQAPTDQLGGYVRIQGGTYDDLQVEAAVNLPFNDKVMLRVAGYEYHRKGYTKVIGGFDTLFNRQLPNIRIDNQDVTEARATLLLKPTDALSNSTIVTYHTDKNRGSPQLVFSSIPGLTPTGQLASPRVMTTDTDLSRSPSDTYAIINTTTYDLSDNLSFKNIAGYIRAEGLTNNPSDPDGTNIPGVDVEPVPRMLHNYQYTDEVQLQGHAFDNKLDFIGGGIIDLTRQKGGDGDINIANNSYSGPGTLLTTYRQSRFTSKSAFGSLTYHLTDTLSVTGGARHIWDNVRERVANYNAVDGVTRTTVPAGVPFQVNAQKFKGWAYNGSAEWRPINGTMLYGGYRRGYKRGGFNQSQILADGAAAPFGAETVDDYYVGLKQDLAPLGLAGHINIEGFYDIYHKAQRSHLAILSLAPFALTTVILNVPKITYRGFDTDFVAEVAPWLELSGNYTFVDAFYGKFTDPTTSPITGATGGDLSVNPVGLVSKHKVSITGRFHHDLSDGGEIALAPTFSYQSRLYFNDGSVRQPNDAVEQVNSEAAGANYASGYKLVDVRVEWNKVLGSNVDLAFNGNNLFNKVFKTGGAGIYLFGFESVAYGPPRLFTVEAKIRF